TTRVNVPSSRVPDTIITAGPSGMVANGFAYFSAESTVPGSSFRCILDDGPPINCTLSDGKAGDGWSQLAFGPHTFEVWAIDGNGNPDPTSATRTWTVGSSSGSLVPNASFE